jgi:hypothetical protein
VAKLARVLPAAHQFIGHPAVGRIDDTESLEQLWNAVSSYSNVDVDGHGDNNWRCAMAPWDRSTQGIVWVLRVRFEGQQERELPRVRRDLWLVSNCPRQKLRSRVSRLCVPNALCVPGTPSTTVTLRRSGESRPRD